MAYSGPPPHLVAHPRGHPRGHPRNLDDWNPMAENYRDPQFNSYAWGPGANFTPFAKSAEDPGYTLYVSNVPPDLTEDGLRNIFNEFGDTLRVSNHVNDRRAFVTYATYQEAEHAVLALNRKRLLQMNVAFAKSDADAAKLRQQRRRLAQTEAEMMWKIERASSLPYAQQDHPEMYNRIVPPNVGRGKQLAALAYRAVPLRPAHCYDMNSDLLYPITQDPTIYNLYEGDEPFEQTNNMWTRARVNDDSNGIRHVTMGRGYNWYELPAPHPAVARQVGKICEKRVAGLYLCGENNVAGEVGTCEYCFKPATMRCQRCNSYYCSKPCQSGDWSRHKVECQPMPGLTGGNISSRSLSDSSVEEPITTNPLRTNQPPPLRRPRTLPDKREPSTIPSTSLVSISSRKEREKAEQVDYQPNDSKENVIPHEHNKGRHTNAGSVHGEVAHVYSSERIAHTTSVRNESRVGRIAMQNIRDKSQTVNDQLNRKENLQNKNVEPSNSHCGNRTEGKNPASNGQYENENSRNQNNDNGFGNKDRRNKPSGANQNYNNRIRTKSRQEQDNQNSNIDDQQRNVNKNGKAGFSQNERHNPPRESIPLKSKGNQHLDSGRNNQDIEDKIQKPVAGNEAAHFKQQGPEPLNKLKSKSYPDEYPDFNFHKPQQAKSAASLSLPPRVVENAFLPAGVFIEVRVILFVREGVYWVQKVDDFTPLTEMMEKLQDEAENSQKVEPSIGNVYAVVYAQLWHRAMLTSLNPKEVLYVDFGNVEEIKSDDFRNLKDPNDPPHFAKKIRVADGTSDVFKFLSEEATMLVMAIGGTSDEILVQVEGENILANPFAPLVPSTSKNVGTATKSQPKLKTENTLPSVVDLIATDEEGCLEVHAVLSNNMVATTICITSVQTEFEKIMIELPMVCEKMSKDPKFSPKDGDLICGKRGDGDWVRGYVTSVGPPWRLIIVDEARVETVHTIMPIPHQFADLPTLGATCELLDKKFKLESMKQYSFFAVESYGKKVDGNGVEVLLSSNETENKIRIRGLLRPWIPAPEQKGLLYARLTSGTEVCLTSYRSHSRMYARSLTEQGLEYYQKIMQDVAKCAVNAPQLIEPPVVGQMVIAKFSSDGNYYRAIVRNVKEKIDVCYVDFGNAESVSLNNLRIISDDLKKSPLCVARITLTDVPQDVPMTKEVNDFLSRLIGMEQRLMCTFDGECALDGVRLRMENGRYVNDKIKELLEPNWKKQQKEDDKMAYMLSDLDVASLGEVGQTVTAIVLDTVSAGVVYTLAPQDTELIKHITEVMTNQIAEYCAATKEHYVPRAKELCLAPFEGVYYRAACLNPAATPTTSTVLFIDFGNIEDVAITDIRLITKDFITIKGLGSTCTVTGLGPVNDRDELPAKIAERVSEMVTPNNFVQVKLIKIDSPGMYTVEMPEVRATLIKEGLIE